MSNMMVSKIWVGMSSTNILYSVKLNKSSSGNYVVLKLYIPKSIYVKPLVVHTVSLFLRLWHPGGCHNVAGSKIKAFQLAESRVWCPDMGKWEPCRILEIKVMTNYRYWWSGLHVSFSTLQASIRIHRLHWVCSWFATYTLSQLRLWFFLKQLHILFILHLLLYPFRHTKTVILVVICRDKLSWKLPVVWTAQVVL